MVWKEHSVEDAVEVMRGVHSLFLSPRQIQRMLSLLFRCVVPRRPEAVLMEFDTIKPPLLPTHLLWAHLFGSYQSRNDADAFQLGTTPNQHARAHANDDPFCMEPSCPLMASSSGSMCR